jgi:hypothetical protein
VEGNVVGEADNRVSLVVQASTSGPPGHLRVLAAREKLATRVGEFGELLQGHRTRRHVHAQRQRLGREHRGQQVALEANLDDLAKGRHHARVMGGEPSAKAVDEVGVLQCREVVLGEVREPRQRDFFYFAALLGRGEEQTIQTALVHGVVARCARKDEHDHRQEVVALEGR